MLNYCKMIAAAAAAAAEAVAAAKNDESRPFLLLLPRAARGRHRPTDRSRPASRGGRMETGERRASGRCLNGKRPRGPRFVKSVAISNDGRGRTWTRSVGRRMFGRRHG